MTEESKDKAAREKMRKVLAMMEGATTEGEAKAAAEALQRLQASTGIGIAEVQAEGEGAGEEVNMEHAMMGFTVPGWKIAMAQAVARNFRCKFYQVDIPAKFDAKRRMRHRFSLGFMGQGEDAEAARDVFVASCSAAESCWKAFREANGPFNKQVARNTYLLGFAEGLGSLWDERRASDECMALALAVPAIVVREFESKVKGTARHAPVARGGLYADGCRDGKAYGEGRSIA